MPTVSPDPLSQVPEGVTRDELRRFGLTLLQPKNGYRFTLDPLLLCDFAGAAMESAIADLGTGSGVMALVLARMAGKATVTALELDGATAQLARENARLNGLEGRIRVLHEDLLQVRRHLPVSCCDLVVSNPPYRKQGRGRLNPDPAKRVARHETTAGLADVLDAAKYLVKPAGRICLVYHPDRLVELLVAATARNLSLVKLRMVHGTPLADAKVLLLELVKGRPTAALRVLPPLIVRSDGEQYTDEVRALLIGN